MLLREIEERDNKQVEDLIRTCLIEFGANKPGTAWTDPNLGDFYHLYNHEGSKYWVVEKDSKIIAGCGIGPISGYPHICELQKMYAFKEARGTGAASQLLEAALDYARLYYNECYLETFNNMVAANKFYQKNGFVALTKPLMDTEHFACDAWYIRSL
ncbi:GNAT family N-acetyltransferase [Paenibacillus sp. FSL H7-0326]|uniref:GNAT family N-acetyltransferase n=1 Tax=Paenibacillus sp. FSL H7-0326 TaxID=1921144 RepID=UPI00096DEE24|nr:GNAT family N-acetyltransferase [Paenibacillus sp. FSL H7-0326]OMC68333.1 GNAT family N-acetyltransferase [Paenibacillus sp. FSL H7-0326]